ncbi:hypothetical protein ZWY2020_040288 [Hordeum vulgare]|nr:hypothetical protein ZWY2020_040288 [Hordeum vulgare]
MDSWSKEDYSRHIREAYIGVEKLPKVNPPSRTVLGSVCSYTNTSPCTSNPEGDAPQLMSKETRPETRYACNPVRAFEDLKPHTPERDPVSACGGYGWP